MRAQLDGRRAALRALLSAAVLLLGSPARAEERFALVVAGAPGGDEYSAQYAQWTGSIARTLVERLRFDPSRVTVLGDSAGQADAATAGNVRHALARVRQQMQAGDLLLVLLIGHGTFDGMDAKFNLVGPDLEASEWAALLRPLPGTVVVVNSASSSFPFLERLSGPRRIVITATDSAAQRFDTVFAEHFAAAFGGDDADIDKNGRISIWEAFASAAGGVRRHYQQRGQLPTERSLLDDNADGVGREAAAQGADGSLASRTYLDAAQPGAAPTDEVLVEWLQRRASLLAEIEELQIKKAFMTPAEYSREFERVMIDLARVSRDIRARVKS
jgi:hypothetical protein